MAALACAGAAPVHGAEPSPMTPPPITRVCVACHGANGLSVAPDAPNLAGQPEIYLQRQIKAYRAGARTHEVMQVVARPLSDEDISVLAAWYSALRVEVRLP